MWAVEPERVPRVAVCESLGSMESAHQKTRRLTLTANYFRWLARWFLEREVNSAGNTPDFTIQRRIESTASTDEPVWPSDSGKLLVAGEPASVQHYGLEPFVREFGHLGRDWGFSLQEIEVPVGI